MILLKCIIQSKIVIKQGGNIATLLKDYRVKRRKEMSRKKYQNDTYKVEVIKVTDVRQIDSKEIELDNAYLRKKIDQYYTLQLKKYSTAIVAIIILVAIFINESFFYFISDNSGISTTFIITLLTVSLNVFYNSTKETIDCENVIYEMCKKMYINKTIDKENLKFFNEKIQKYLEKNSDISNEMDKMDKI